MSLGWLRASGPKSKVVLCRFCPLFLERWEQLFVVYCYNWDIFKKDFKHVQVRLLAEPVKSARKIRQEARLKAQAERMEKKLGMSSPSPAKVKTEIASKGTNLY